MTADLLYCCKVQDFSEDYSLTLEFLSTLDIFVGTWESREEKTVFHTLYATDPATTRQAMVQLEEQMPMWADFGIKLGELEYFELPKEDWTEVWKKYFHILHIQ